MKALTKLAAAAFTAFLSLPASAETVGATNPLKLVEVIRALGYPAQLDIDGVGDPMIISNAADVDFWIFFHGCVGGMLCETVLFTIGFDLRYGTTLETVDAWNRAALLGRAYLDDEDDPWLELGVHLGGGVSRQNFEQTLILWEGILDDFKRHIDF